MACNPTPPFIPPEDTDYGDKFVGGVPDQDTFVPTPVVSPPWEPCPDGPPIIVVFDIPPTSTTLLVPILVFSVSDPEFYLVTESSIQPEITDPNWTIVKPASYLFATEGPKILYAWALNADGLSGQALDTTVITLPVAPIVTAFDIPATSLILLVPVLTFEVTGADEYLLTESASTPSLSDPGWSTTKQTEYLFDSAGFKTLYAWGKNSEGLSNQLSDTTTITLIIEVCDLPLSRFTLEKTRTLGTVAQGLIYSCIDWSDDGLHMYMGILGGNQIRNWKSTTTAWDLDALSFVGLFRTGYNDVHGVKVKPDGSEVWANASTGLGNGHTLSYSLPTNYEWTETGGSAPSSIDDFDNARAEFKHLEELNINPEGTRIISPGNDSGSFPYQLNMMAWDGSSLAYGPDNKVADCENAFITQSGLCMYRANSSQTITKYELSTAWDLSTLSGTVVDTLDLSGDLNGNIVGIHLTEDRLYVVDDGSPAYTVYQYNS